MLSWHCVKSQVEAYSLIYMYMYVHFHMPVHINMVLYLTVHSNYKLFRLFSINMLKLFLDFANIVTAIFIIVLVGVVIDIGSCHIVRKCFSISLSENIIYALMEFCTLVDNSYFTFNQVCPFSRHVLFEKVHIIRFIRSIYYVQTLLNI